MLPNNPLAARQRQHRRQNSSPSGFESTGTANNLPNMHQAQQQPHQQHNQQQRPRVSHRRGMSLDIRRQQIMDRRQQMHSPTTPLRQEFTMHVLREAQQQDLARPGPQHQQAYANLATGENYLVSPHATPQIQNFEGPFFDGLPTSQDMTFNFDMYNGPMNVVLKKNQDGYAQNMTGPQDFELFPTSTLSTPTFMNFQDSPTGAPGWISEGETSSSRSTSRRVSNGIMDRVSKFETMGFEQRPRTPPKQNATDYFPLTPMETPHDRTIRHSQRPQRFTEGYDESTEETVKPMRQSSNRRPQTTFDEMRQAAEAQPTIPTPNRASTMPMPSSYDPASVTSPDFLSMSQANHGDLRVDTTFHGHLDMSHPLSAPSNFSHQASPMTPSLVEYSGGGFDCKPDLGPSHARSDVPSNQDAFPPTETPSRRISPHRRTESVASIASAASIASIDIDQAKTTTGITTEDIKQYIQEPDPRDNLWVCTFKDCNKKFGRKENIKSHVQTHLGDRQYQCPTCKKCFVRQHDLKRHAKIHTGIKPYPCKCGNSFARHDALTRHKQRGMCIGAFDGIVKKTAKRGRPRKHRPDNEERKEKATRTRKKNLSISSASSHAWYSDSSAVNSPENAENDDFEMLDDIMDVSMGGTSMNPSSLQGGSSSAPMPALAADPAMSAHSPSAGSIHSYVSQLSHMSLHPEATGEALPSEHVSPADSIVSPYNEPPELSHSSSRPTSSHFYDVEPNSSGLEAAISSASEASNLGSLDGMPEDIDGSLLLGYSNSGSAMLMSLSGSKFDEAFDSVDMFTDNDDVFFGSV
ncbi:Uu.00g140600.m01.CDS01 [Anthostomella pinea]|uniref:Uu.00g140600.m01.CDS01 n=1 Tax=Anthostomella pinea TaxID=933095 RepID=A0AAI8YLF3_9PEZI|nr:Uu.00g140600.m01.CDS01 [Anthostomella pinea]